VLFRSNAGDDIIWVFSSAGDNVIDGGTGDDNISTMHNGNDWIKGGDGNDIIAYRSQNGDMITTAQTNSIIEGGSGSDIILGHYTQTNQLFGDSYGDMATLIAAGEVAPNSNERGDFISDYYLYDSGQQSSEGFIYGSNGSDILINNTGKGLIVGGGGDEKMKMFVDNRLAA
jgi:Ca2+-binding RTX toxin-like protein